MSYRRLFLKESFDDKSTSGMTVTEAFDDLDFAQPKEEHKSDLERIKEAINDAYTSGSATGETVVCNLIFSAEALGHGYVKQLIDYAKSLGFTQYVNAPAAKEADLQNLSSVEILIIDQFDQIPREREALFTNHIYGSTIPAVILITATQLDNTYHVHDTVWLNGDDRQK